MPESKPRLLDLHGHDLGRWHGGRADGEYVRILHLAASTLEARVERGLCQLMETGVALAAS